MSNIAVVVLDTLRKDAFDEHFDWLPGIRYENAWSTSGWTIPVHGSLFGGVYPSELGVHSKAKSLTCKQQVLAEHLSQAGYTTRGFSANGYISETYGFARGFDKFEHRWDCKWSPKRTFELNTSTEFVNWKKFMKESQTSGIRLYLQALYYCLASDADTFWTLRQGLKTVGQGYGLIRKPENIGGQLVLEMIQNTDFENKEFLFMNLVEAHTDYDPPEQYKTVEVDTTPTIAETICDGPDEDPEEIHQAYNDSVRYLSYIYEKVFSNLLEHFDYIITLSDHRLQKRRRGFRIAVRGKVLRANGIENNQ